MDQPYNDVSSAEKKPNLSTPIITGIVIAVVVIVGLALGLGLGLGLASSSPARVSPSTSPSVSPPSSLFTLEKSYSGAQLHDTVGTEFEYFTDPDPTHGYVTYGAHPSLLTTVETTKLRIDIGPGPGARPAIRLQSLFQFNTGLVVIDVEHVPSDLSTWPAFWTTGHVQTPSTWALHGEIDIIEQINGVDANKSSLHANTPPFGTPCQMDFGLRFNPSMCFATSGTKTCGFDSQDFCPFEGCGKDMKSGTFGQAFNAHQGGTYAMYLAQSGQISIWFWVHGADVPDFATITSTDFTNVTDFIVTTACPSQFIEQRIIINTTLCGDWAGQPHPPQWHNNTQCQLYVDAQTFTDAYWLIRSLQFYSVN